MKQTAIVFLIALAILGWFSSVLRPSVPETGPNALVQQVYRVEGVISTLIELPHDTPDATVLELAGYARTQTIEGIRLAGESRADVARLDVVLARLFEVLQAPLAEGSVNRDELLELVEALSAEAEVLSPVQENEPLAGLLFPALLSLAAIGVGFVALFSRLKPTASSRSVAGTGTAADTTSSAFADAPAFATVSAGSAAGAGDSYLPEGVSDRKQYAAIVMREKQRAKRYGRALSSVNVRVSNADRILSEYGESDLAYVCDAIAELASDNTRSSDFVSITSMSEITILLPETDVSQAQLVANKLKRNVELFPFAGEIAPKVSMAARNSLE